MHIYAKLIQVNCRVVFALFLTACTTVKPAPQKIADCSVGQECILEGILNIYISANGAVGILNDDGKCISLALPQNVIQNRKALNEKRVWVRGDIYSNASASGVISYTLLDRDVLVGMCSAEKIMYVERINKSN